jgi:hypothetical protein
MADFYVIDRGLRHRLPGISSLARLYSKQNEVFWSTTLSFAEWQMSGGGSRYVYVCSICARTTSALTIAP